MYFHLIEGNKKRMAHPKKMPKLSKKYMLPEFSYKLVNKKLKSGLKGLFLKSAKKKP